MNIELDTLIESYPNFKQCSLQTFDDWPTKNTHLARILNNSTSSYKKLEELNKQWAWIFFSVNPMKEWKRDKESVIWISSWICEIDWLDKKLQEKMINHCPLKPSLIIESKSSFHLYWFAKDWTKDNWNKICNWLRNYFDWDSKVIDISRVLRLPWFNHLKNPEDPFMISVFNYDWSYYTEDQMIKSYPNIKSVSEIKQAMEEKEHKVKSELWWDFFWDRVKSMDSKMMLEKISWNKMVWWELLTFHKNTNWTEQIFSNHKPTSSWIDKNWKIWSYDWWWPNWTNWVFWYWLCTGSELAKWIKDNFPEMCESKVIPKKESKIIDNDIQMDFGVKTPFTRWLSSLDKKFWRIWLHQLVVTIWESQSWKTEYTFFQARKNADRWNKVCYIWLEMDKKKMITRICLKTAWVTKQEWDDHTYSDKQRDIMNNKFNELKNYKNLEIIYMSKPTIDNIKDIIIEMHWKWFEFFYIDNLWFIVWDMPEIELTALAIRELKDLTNNLPLSINLLHHFNKWGTKDRTWPRWMASIRSSWKIENDVDYVVQVRRDLDEDLPQEERKYVWIYLQKDRVWWEPSRCGIIFDRWNYIEHKEEITKKEIKQEKEKDEEF